MSYLRWQLEKGVALGTVNIIAFMVLGLIILALAVVIIPGVLIYYSGRFFVRRHRAKGEKR